MIAYNIEKGQVNEEQSEFSIEAKRRTDEQEFKQKVIYNG